MQKWEYLFLQQWEGKARFVNNQQLQDWKRRDF
jgi:hypothetical protein